MKIGLFLIPLILAACVGSQSGLDTAALRSAEIAGVEDVPVVLDQGVWEGQPYVEGGAARPRIGLVEEFEVRGDFGETGRQDCAVLVWHHTGGSGTRLWLVVLTSGSDRPRTIASTLVGDRVQVIHFSYHDGQIWLDVIAHGPADAACCPGQLERRGYRFAGDELVGITEIVGRASTRDLGGETWLLEKLRRGDEKTIQFEVTLEFDGSGGVLGESGCNAYAGSVIDADGKNIEVSVRATSARRCPDDRVDMQVEYLRRLEAAERFSFLNGRLALQYTLDGESDVMVFAPVQN